jgi:CelD/BcsL family acetyltransferase involved in cellulose biosynthesis
VFQSFEYLWQWWKYFGHWNELRVLVIRRDDSVIGVAPLMIEHFPIFGRTVRKLMFITAPMEMSRPKFIFGRDSDTCLPALLAYLETAAETWDIFDIDEQLNDDDAERVRAHFRKSGCFVAESQTICPYIELEGTWEQFLALRSKKLRSNINRLRRKLSTLGEVSIRRVNRWPALEAAFATHCEIEERSWKAKKQLHIPGDKSHYFFYEALARNFGGEGNFELRLLECGGKPIASTFGLVHDNVFQSLKIAHDSEHDNLSPGTVLESYELEDLFGAKLARYEFMGSFLANKLRWTSTVCQTTNMHIYQRQPRLMLFYFIFFVFKRWVKSVLKKTGHFDKVDSFLSRFKNNPFPSY